MSTIPANAPRNLHRSNVLLAHLSCREACYPHALACHGSGRRVSLRITNDAGVQGCRVLC